MIILAAVAVSVLILFGLGTGLRDRMIEDLQSPDRAVRLAAISYFVNLDDSMARAFTALMCADPDPVIRHMAISMTAEFPTPGVLKPLAAAYEAGIFRGDPYSMRTYARILAAVEAPGATDRILAMAGEADVVTAAGLSGSLASCRSFDGPETRRLIKACSIRGFGILTSAVARTRSPGLAYEILKTAATPEMRDPAFRMVMEIGRDAVALLPSLFHGADQELKIRILRVIGQFGNGDIGGIIRLALKNGSQPVRRTALRAAAGLGDDSALSALAPLTVSILESSQTALATDAIALLEISGATQFMPVMMKAYYRLPESARNRIVGAVAASGSLAEIARFLNSTSTAERLQMAVTVSSTFGPAPPPDDVRDCIVKFVQREFDKSVMLGFVDSLVRRKAAWGAACIEDWRYLPEPALQSAIARLDALVEAAGDVSGIAGAEPAAVVSPSGRPAKWVAEFSDPAIWRAWVTDILAPEYGYDQGCDLSVISADHLWDPNLDTRRRAMAYAALHLTSEAVVPLTLLLDGDPPAAEDAADALAALEKLAVPYLTAAVDGAFPARAIAILRAASGMASVSDRVKILEHLEKHHDKRVRHAARFMRGN